jgi:RNA polymerase sigma factor (sigma-70 family)
LPKQTVERVVPFKINLKDIPLLTREGEVELASLIKKGGDAGERARQTFIESNIRLVIKIANDYANYGVDLDDLVSEGCIGLTVAVDKFDASLGNKFSTYASWWIRQKISRSLPEKGRLIRLPIYMSQRQASVYRFSEDFKLRRGRNPTNGEIARSLKLTVDNVVTAIRSRESTTTTSMDRALAVDEQEGRTFGDTLEDSKSLDPLTTCENLDESRAIKKGMKKLTNRERYVLENRFGFSTGEKRTLEVIGGELSITRERVRQIESKALRRLRIFLKRKL